MNRLAKIALATAIGGAAVAMFAAPAQAAQIDVWNGFTATGGFDYRTTNDTTFSNNRFNDGSAMNNAISSVHNYSSSARLCTGASYTGTCISFQDGLNVNLQANLAAYNNNFESIYF